MSGAHTPGPWGLATDGTTIDAPDGCWVGYAAYDAVGEHVAEANARLMHAAPEMLEALRYIVGWKPEGWSAETARDRARAAILKATGEQAPGA